MTRDVFGSTCQETRHDDTLPDDPPDASKPEFGLYVDCSRHGPALDPEAIWGSTFSDLPVKTRMWGILDAVVVSISLWEVVADIIYLLDSRSVRLVRSSWCSNPETPHTILHLQAGWRGTVFGGTIFHGILSVLPIVLNRAPLDGRTM